MFMNKKSGISLFELLITASIISTLTAVGITTFAQCVKTQKSQAGIEQIAYIVKKAKYHARTSGVITTLLLTAGSNNYNLTSDGESLIRTDSFDVTSGSLPENIVIISNSCNDINFDSTGFLIDSSGNIVYENCSVTVGYSNGPQKTISIKGKTGNIEYE